MKQIKDVSSAEERTSYAERLIGVLQLFAQHSDVLSLSEIGEKLALPRSSTHRILEPLVTLGIIERAQGRRYRIGTELYRFALRIQDQFALMNVAKPIMIETARQAGETCLLGLLTPCRRRLVLVHKIDATRSSPCSFDLLENITPAWGALGRAIMAWVGPGDLASIVKNAGPAPATGEALPPPAVLQEELATIRKSGLAFSDGKRGGLNVRGIAAPFFDNSGQVRGSMGIIVPRQRHTEEARAQISRILQAQSAQLSRILGHRRRAAPRKRVVEVP